MPVHCEVVEVRNSADAVGYPCSRTTSKECSDCGIQLCEDHVESCGGCHAIFCPPCFLFHRAQHSKPAHGERRERCLIFHDKHLPLTKWFLATYLLCQSRKGMSANQL